MVQMSSGTFRCCLTLAVMCATQSTASLHAFSDLTPCVRPMPDRLSPAHQQRVTPVQSLTLQFQQCKCCDKACEARNAGFALRLFMQFERPKTQEACPNAPKPEHLTWRGQTNPKHHPLCLTRRVKAPTRRANMCSGEGPTECKMHTLCRDATTTLPTVSPWTNSKHPSRKLAGASTT